MRAVALGRGCAGIFLFSTLWQVSEASGFVHYAYLPAPTAIARGLITLVVSGKAFLATVHTLRATLIGWSIASIVGVSSGVLLGTSSFLRRYSLTTIEVLRPLPAVALVPIGLLLFGFSIKTELFVIFIPTIWPVLVNTMAGIQAVPFRLREVGHCLRLNRLHAVTKILIPAAAPAILVGLRLGLSIALILSIITEMIGIPHGLGYAIVMEAQALRPNLMFAYVFIIGILGILLNASLISVAKIMLPGEFCRPRSP